MNPTFLTRWIVLCWLIMGTLVPEAAAQTFSFGSYQVVSSKRIGRTDFEYELRVRCTNNVANANGLTATVFSTQADTIILENKAEFGDMPFESSKTSTDTFRIRQNRVTQFNPAALRWFVAVESMPLTVTVLTPEDDLLTKGDKVTVTGTFGSAVEKVMVGSVTATLASPNFSAEVLLEEGRNEIKVVASNAYGGSGTDQVVVYRDTSAPVLNIESPADGAIVSSRQLTVQGLVNDAVPGTVNPEQASVIVNGLAANVLNRSYAISEVLLTPGKNKIQVKATDRAGNESKKEIEVTFVDPGSKKRLVRLVGDAQSGAVNSTLATPLVVELVNGNGVVETNQPVTFTVTRNDGNLVASPSPVRTLSLLTDDNGQAQVLFQLGTRSGVANNQVTVTSPGVAADLQFTASGTSAPPAKVTALLPETQVGEVNKPLAFPWTALVTDAGGNPVAGVTIQFVAFQGDGGNFDGETTVSRTTDGDGRASALFTLGPGAGINNYTVLAFVPELADSSAVFTASGHAPAPSTPTRILGLVLDNANRPMSNILCTVLGTTLITTTDEQGQFTINNPPTGSVRLLADARDRGYPGEWHSLEFNLVVIPGIDNTLDRPIYMLPLDASSKKVVGGSEDVTLTLKGFPGSSLTVYKNSLRDSSGKPITAEISWTQVNGERVPMTPPMGSQPILTTAIQPANFRFDPPAKMCVPNVGLPAGQIVELFGFDHDLGSFVSVGTATVSADGAMICSAPGFGVKKSGWHPVVPPPPPCTGVGTCPAKPADDACTKWVTVPKTSPCACDTFEKKEAKVLSFDAKAEGEDVTVVSTNQPVTFSVINLVTTNCSGLEYEWDFGDGTPKDNSAGPTHSYTTKGDKTVTVKVRCTGCEASAKTDTVEVGVAIIRFARSSPEDATGNKFGYDEMDTPNDSTDDHVSVAKGDATFVEVVVDGTTKYDKIFLKSTAEGEIKLDPDKATGATTKLKVLGQNSDKGMAKIEARGGKENGPVASSMTAHVYKKVSMSGKFVRIYKKGDEAGTIPPDLDTGQIATAANGHLKYPVFETAIASKAKLEVDFDKNGNGVIDFYGSGNNDEWEKVVADLKAAGYDYTDVALVKDVFPHVWRLGANVAINDTTVTVAGIVYTFNTSETFSLGGPKDEDSESFRITSIVGNVLTIDTDAATAGNQGFTKNHAKTADDTTSHRVKSLGHSIAGTSADETDSRPALVTGLTVGYVGKVMAHEQMHGKGLSDVNDAANVMHYNTGNNPTTLPFRFKELVAVETGTPTPKSGSPKENQWNIPPR